ncbi:hypothetical protein ACQ5SO_09400 [Rhodovulum sp. DZ06]
MGRVLKYLFYLVILGLAALAIFAAVADLPPPTAEVEVVAPDPTAD